MTIKRSILGQAYQERIRLILDQGPATGMQVHEIVRALGLAEDRRRWVRDQLRKMARDGLVQRRGGCYLLPDRSEPTGAHQDAPVQQDESADRPPSDIVGVLQQHPSGRAFVSRGEAHEDVLIPPRQRGGALDGDTVAVELRDSPRSRRQTGRVVRVTARGRVRLTGILEPPLLSPDDTRILARVEVEPTLPPENRADDAPRAGDAVLARIVVYPSELTDPIRVRIDRRLGEPGLLLTEVEKCVAGGGVEESFSPRAQEDAAAMPSEVQPEDLHERLDLRHLHFVTIDPLTARDFDDAVAVEHGPAGTMRVWVAVADVSHYVAEGSVLDVTARGRGCSIYLPDRAIPMLPPLLSSGICSLVPDRDRLAMTVRLDITEDGKVVDEACVAAVIHSRGQLDYNGVAAALQGEFAGRREAYRDHADLLDCLQLVASALHRQRLRRGSLELDLPEAEVQLDQDDPNRVRDVVQSRPEAPVKRAYNLIEELMVAANEVVGRLFQRADRPAIWRIHGTPRPEAVETLRSWMSSYGLLLASGPPDGKMLSRLVQQLVGHRAARPLSFLVLRTLKQAIYGVNNIGHFGLASPAYLHFTSPIRRYPDLHVHRLVKQMLRAQGRPAGRKVKVRAASEGVPLHHPAAPRQGCEDRHALAELAAEASARERRAIEVEREVQRVYASSLMRDRIGDEGWGTVTGVNSFGFFVTLDHPFVEGLVRCDRLPAAAEFDPWQLRLVTRTPDGQRQVFSLGDRVLVRVTDTSVRRRQIDLAPVPGEGHHEDDPGYVPDVRRQQRQAGGHDRRERRPHRRREGGGRRSRR